MASTSLRSPHASPSIPVEKKSQTLVRDDGRVVQRFCRPRCTSCSSRNDHRIARITAGARGARSARAGAIYSRAETPDTVGNRAGFGPVAPPIREKLFELDPTWAIDRKRTRLAWVTCNSTIGSRSATPRRSCARAGAGGDFGSRFLARLLDTLIQLGVNPRARLGHPYLRLGSSRLGRGGPSIVPDLPDHLRVRQSCSKTFEPRPARSAKVAAGIPASSAEPARPVRFPGQRGAQYRSHSSTSCRPSI